MMEMPTTPAGLNATWLTTALRQWGGAGAVTVASFTLTRLGENQGFYGQLVRVHLRYVGDARGAPRTLIAKFAAANMRQRSRASYLREVLFYQRLARASPLPVPICYYAEIDEGTGDHVLLLQDLVPLQNGRRVAGCTLAQARVAISEVVKLHAQWWGKTADPALNWLEDDNLLADPAHAHAQYDAWWPNFYAQAKTQLPPELVGPSQALGRHRSAIRYRVFGGPPRTLIHRDFQLDNLFFGPEDSLDAGDGTAFAVVDWQFFSRGLGVWDVAYFLSESLLPADRRQVEMELLTGYHQTLVAQGVVDYSFAQCYEDYRYALLQRHTALVSTIAAMPFGAAQREIHIHHLLPRNIAALIDHDAFAVLPAGDS